MAKIITDSQHYQDIANKIRSYTKTTTQYRPVDMVNGIDEVYALSGAVTNPDYLITAVEMGNPIALNDISEIPHQIEITIDKNTEASNQTAELIISGKNLVQPTTAIVGGALSGGGVNNKITISTNNASAHITIPYIRVLPNTRYTFSLDNTEYWLRRICEMNSNNLCTVNHSFYTNTAYNYSSHSFTTKANTTWLALGLINTTGASASLSDLIRIKLQLERNSANTEYEDYWAKYYSIAENENIIFPSSSTSLYCRTVDNINIDDNDGTISVAQNNMNFIITYNRSYGQLQTKKQSWFALIQQIKKISNNNYLFRTFTDDTFYPYSDFDCPANSNYIFFQSGITDLAGKFSKHGTILNTVNVTSSTQMFYGSSCTHIPELNLSNSTSLASAFQQCTSLQTIDNSYLTALATKIDGIFTGCSALQNLTISGEIAASGFTTKDSKLLTKDSIISIITHLSQSTSGLSITLNLISVNNAFETAPGLADGASSTEWSELLNQYASNWTVNLV